MSWYRLILVFITLFSLGISKEIMVISDDELIIRGLFYDEYQSYENARQIYAKLFDTTQAEVYLFKEATASLLGRTHLDESIQKLKAWDAVHPNALQVKRLLIPLYLTSNQVNLAKTQAEYLIERSSAPTDLELASNPFLYTGEFKRALSLLSKVYEANPKEDVLLRMVNIMDEYTEERTRAIQLLETHIRMNVYSNEVLKKLLVLYGKEKNIDGLLDTYKLLYQHNKDEKILSKIIDIYAYKRDLSGAITFLEKYKADDDMLYELYKSKKQFDKALVFVNRRYKSDKNAKWLAEKGVLLFEKADDKNNKEMIEKVSSLFDKALALGVDDSIYLNYYGYTLIDKNIDIDKGIKIIKDALVQQPDNTYYLDSLAWGYYKKHACKKAYTFMKRVVDAEGLDEQEIVEHWNAIKQCK
ncbi:MAG: hypothetical protein DSZ09_04935 [Sulfurovum sp.]|nr:MAG: hypothetical protein DSZ09_04935 [Sulfurovum sp.]